VIADRLIGTDSVFKRYHSDKHFSEIFTYNMAAKKQLARDMEQNYVSVTLRIMIDWQQQRRVAGLLLSAGACSKYRSTAGTRRRCGQRHVENRGARLNTDSFLFAYQL